MPSLEDIRKKLSKYNQSHVLQFWDELSVEAQDEFLKQLSGINFDDVNNLFNRALTSLSAETIKLDTLMKPIPPGRFEYEKGVDVSILDEYRQKGLEAISNSQVAVVLLAGGQGTRLGVPYPKGMCPLGLPSGKTLFQLQAERIRSLTRLAKKATGTSGKVCWYIMTSKATHEETAKYLQKHKYFGLNEDDVVLFQQGLLPSFSMDGRIILDRKDSISLSPDGNGGIYLALEKNNVIEDMERRGIKYVHVHSVDNVLVKVADPVFIGYCITKRADCGNKVVRKEIPTERVGVVCQVDGRFQVVEYSEITDQTANLRDEDGNLVFRAGNICNHFFTIDFLRSISKGYENELKLHVAKKKIPFLNDKGERVIPSSPNGIKIEKFIFDVFQFSKNFVTWEVPRHTDFSPVKNSESAESDCPSTARRDLLKLHKMYIQDACGTVTCDEVEISPLLSYAGENLTKVYGKVFDTRTVILSDEEVTSNGGESADLGQFPWIALLGYKQKNVDFIEYLCGGTIITERYILTAAHCLKVGQIHELVTVRVGEHNLQTKKDCTTILGIEHCSETPVDLSVMQRIQHPDYNHKKIKHDIALVKVETTITFTDYVQPICLPFGRNMESTDLTDQKFTISGWGKTESKNIGGSSILQFAFVRIWNQSECNKVVPPEVQPITDSQICANGRKEDACKGDSGGPLFNASLDANDQLRNFQIGIVSFASTVACGIEDLPAIYTRVDKYLDWIVDSIK